MSINLERPGVATNGVSLSNEPTLLFLHGVGDGNLDGSWKSGLTKELIRLGYPDPDTARIIAPKYAHALIGSDDNVPLPGLTIKQPVREAARKNRRDFERRTGAIEFRLGRHNRGNGRPGGDAVVNLAVELFPFAQARNYVKNPQIRAQVLTRILRELPESGSLVIVGHSLGSVIAADLLRRLPVGVKVAGMITVGSPLGNGNFDVDKLRDTLREPPTNLAWWVNFWNVHDPVAAYRGVSSVFPWLVDFRIQTRMSHHAHDAAEYLTNEDVVEAIGFALFGSKSKDVVKIEQGIDIPLDGPEIYSLVALRYAHHTMAKLEGDKQDRFAGALRQVQAKVVDEIARRNASEGRAIPSAVARLAFDLSDPLSPVPEPLPNAHFGKEEAVALLTVLAAENVIRPYEISLPKDKWRDAMKDLTSEMGLGSQYGADVFAAAERAQEALSGNRVASWKKWGALGAGAAALVVATGGLALAAGAGLAGAAAITSALASFGPGGMIGGLITAGTLVGAGSGGIAFSLASPGTSAETLEAVVERWLAAAILRQLQHLEPDSNLWRNLVEMEIEVRRELERLDEFSDESAPTLKELKRKVEIIERALKYLSVNGLEPSAASTAPEETD